MSSPEKLPDQSGSSKGLIGILVSLGSTLGCTGLAKLFVSEGTPRTTALLLFTALLIGVTVFQSAIKLHPSIVEMLRKCLVFFNKAPTPDGMLSIKIVAFAASVTLAGMIGVTFLSIWLGPRQFAITLAKSSAIAGPTGCDYKISVTWIDEKANIDQYELINRSPLPYSDHISTDKGQITGSFDILGLSCAGFNQCTDEVILLDSDGNYSHPQLVVSPCTLVQTLASNSLSGS